MEIVPLTVEQALTLLVDHERHYRSNAKPLFAIGLSDGTDDGLCGAVIVGATESAGEVQLSHIYSAGESRGYTLLYGAAWRAAKSLGYTKMVL